MILSRRELLLKALYGATFLSTQPAFSFQSDLESYFDLEQGLDAEKIYDTIVIGAGISGLTAAKNLAFPSSGKKKQVLVLEASDRIGGRIQTLFEDRFGGPIELGAAFIHVDPTSVPLGKDLEKNQVPLRKINRLLNGLIYYDGWEDNLKKEYEMMFHWSPKEMLTFAKEIDSYNGPDMSGKQWLAMKKYSPFGRALVDLYLTGHTPGALRKISIKGYGSDKYSEMEMGWYERGFVKGYSHFIHQLTQGHDQYRGQKLGIRLGQIVKNIKYGPHGVEIVTDQGKVFRSKTAVITVSAGVLKSEDIIFDPPLPQEKRDALSCIEMGDEAKVVLKFTKRFWPSETTFINRIDPVHEMCRTYMIPFAHDESKNKVLVALFAGDEADKIRTMSDQSVIEALCRDFDKMFPHAAPTYRLLEIKEGVPNSLRYQWADNQFTKGADSFLRVGGVRSVPVKQARQVLSKPQSTPGLFWAGEATAHGEGISPASSHGAHYSGHRAAIEVAAYLKKIEKE